MLSKYPITFLVVLFFGLSSISGAPADQFEPASPDMREIDDDSYVDANRLFEVITNVGILGFDQRSTYGGPWGLYFPYTGYPSFPGENTLTYSSGLWLGGKVNGDIRVSVAEYSTDYVPGPMAGGTYQPDNPQFKVYKIDASSGPGDPDYDNWPINQGAPTDGGGNPLLSGDQTLWSVFNDAGPDQHYYFTDPLGVEVQQTVWASDDIGEQTIVNVKYLLYNKGSNTIEDFYIGFWADGDLGGPTDDFVGCDSADNIFYYYNDGSDDDYGAMPPAWGGKLVSGPVVPAPGETAEFDGNPLPDHRNVSLNSFTYYSLGNDPQDRYEAYNNLQGLDADGNPFIDPTTAQLTKFTYSGDPVTANGWTDPAPGDKRCLISMGPFTFAPGDSQQVVLKFAAASGTSPLTALTTLRQSLNVAAPEYPAPTFASCDSAVVSITNYGELMDVYSTGDLYWLTGFPWGGEFYRGGADLASKLYGSNLSLSDLDDVEIRFSHDVTQFGYRYLYSISPELDYAGYYEVPFTAWDVTNNRQLNVLFTEDATSAVYDSTWGPATTDVATNGGREIIVITDSDYSAYDPANNPHDYESSNLADDAAVLDLQYALWARVPAYNDLSELEDGQKIRFLRQTSNPNGNVDTVFFELPEGLRFRNQEINVGCFGPNDRILSYDLSSNNRFFLTDAGAIFDGGSEHTTLVRFYPQADGDYSDVLEIRDVVTGSLLQEVVLVGRKSSLLPHAVIEPDTMRYFFQYAIDTINAICFFGDFDDGHTVSDVDLASVALTTDQGTVSAADVLQYPGHGDFFGGVIGIEFDAREFVADNAITLGKQYLPYTVIGSFNDGDSFAINSRVVMTGHLPGDVNFDGKIGAGDAVFLISYIFGGEAPDPLEAGDLDCSGVVTISDAVLLIGYIFAGGPTPCR